MNTKKFYKVIRQGMSYSSDFEGVTVVDVDEPSCDIAFNNYVAKYILMESFTVVGVETTNEPVSVNHESFIDSEIWF